MNSLFLYSLAACAARYQVRVHAFCAMSTHIHMVLTDTGGNLPEFLQQLHRVVALGTKVLRKWEGPVWDHMPASIVRLETPSAVLEKIGYTLANPVAAGLVRLACEWPGAKSDVNQMGAGGLVVSRPGVYFDPAGGTWPEEATLELSLPPFVEPHEAGAFRAEAGDVLARLESEGQQDVEARGWRVLGARRVLRSSPYDRASTFEALRARNPTLAVGRVDGAYQRATDALRAFRAAYRAALDAWRAGVRSAVFPAGTYWMVRCHSVVVAT